MITTNASLLRGKELTNLKQNDIFDRVINLKLTMGEGETANEFLIRSDFEVVYPNLDITNVFKENELFRKNIYYVKKCLRKPAIKVQYTRNSSAVNTEIDIFISNFYLFDAKGGKTDISFSDVASRLTKVELMMGYFGQFKQFFSTKLETGTITYDDLLKFEPGYGVDVITINSILYVTVDKMAPDSIIHIHGVIGSTYSSQLGDIRHANYDSLKADGLIEETAESLAYNNDTFIENLFFKHITKRFPKKEVKGLSYTPSGELSDIDALEYGIKVFCSKGVQKLSNSNMFKVISGYKYDDPKTKTGKHPIEQPMDVFFASGTSAVNTYHHINTALGGILLMKQLNNGNWIVFTKEESDEGELLDHFDKRDVEKINTEGEKYFNNVIPAVYNISVGALTTITCPFFYFVEPFKTINFVSRYTLTSLVDYYTDGVTGNFTVLKQQVSFATVEDINECEFICDNKGTATLQDITGGND